MSLLIRVGALHVYREKGGIRFTIPTVHSSTVLTRAEAHEVTKVLVEVFRQKRKPKDGAE